MFSHFAAQAQGVYFINVTIHFHCAVTDLTTTTVPFASRELVWSLSLVVSNIIKFLGVECFCLCGSVTTSHTITLCVIV